MTTTEHTGDVKIGASAPHSPVQLPLKLTTEYASHQGTPTLDLVTSDRTTRNRTEVLSSETLANFSSPQGPTPTSSELPTEVPTGTIDSGAVAAALEQDFTPEVRLDSSATSISEHDFPNEIPPINDPEDNQSFQPLSSEVHAIVHKLFSALFAGHSDQKASLKDIFLEYSSPRHFDDELTLAVMRSDSFEILHLTKVSPTKWKAVKNIEFQRDDGYMTLIIHSEDTGDEAFLEFTAEEIHDMAMMIFSERDIPMEYAFALVDDDIPMSVKMTSTLASSSNLGSDAKNAYLLGMNGVAVLHRAVAFQRRFEKTGNLDDITQAISYYNSAIPSVLPFVDFLPAISCSLGNSYKLRFEHTGDLKEIDIAISYYQTALDYTPVDHGDRSICFNYLANSYSSRFQLTSNLQDIDLAISHRQCAVESTPSAHADGPGHLSDLGALYDRRFEHTGDLQDIDHAISHHQTAVGSAPPGHPDLPIWLNNLATSYISRFERTANLKDINLSISCYQTALNSTPSDHPDLPARFNNLGNSYFGRFERTGDLQDLDYAISHHETALNSVPAGHADIPSRFNNLGSSYLRRFERTGDLQDIGRAISHLQTAVDSTPSGNTDLPIFFTNLGTAFLRRFELTGNLQDIEHAISDHQTSVKSTSPGDADLPSRFNNLGNSYLLCFRHTGDLRDVDNAISHHQRAVDSSPSGHASLPSRCQNLGTSYHLRFQFTHDLLDVQNSITSYRRAAEASGIPSFRLHSASQAVILSSDYDDSHCLTDCAVAIGLLSEVAGLEQTIDRRHTNLHGHSDLVRSAVATALRFDEVDLALEWLEQGRCLVWNQLNQLRTPIDNLRMANPSLANRFKKVASALESYGTRSEAFSASSVASSHSTLADDIRLQGHTLNHTLCAAEYAQLLQEIRCLPDFHDFLKPPKAANLLSLLPSDGPVIIFNVHSTRCDALAVISGVMEPLHIPLKDFSVEHAKKLQNTIQFDVLEQRELEDQDRAARRAFHNPSSMSFVLKELWCKVVQPILEALGYPLESPLNPLNRSRIWWCPTGPLSFLPLHAAGIYDSAYQPGLRVSDFVVSSYTPTVRSLTDKFMLSSTPSRFTDLVLISQPNTPGLRSIPSTKKETHALEVLMKSTGIEARLLEDSKATREKVKAEMKSRNWVHFACHGVQDILHPLDSGLCLHDGRLELLEIIRQEIQNPELAFLSACQTSKGDVKLSEEVVHLAAGMLAAGYRGVVGTMWSISDTHGPEFAKEFYQYLVKEKRMEGLDSTRAAYALDFATKQVRESLGNSDAAFLTWVPYVHYGY